MQKKRRLTRLLLTMAAGVLLLGQQLSAQQVRCGTKLDPETQRYMDATRDMRQNWDMSAMRGTIRWIPVTWHIFRATNGSGGASLSSIPVEMARLNRDFAGANIQFFLCGAPKVIQDDRYFAELTKAEEKEYGKANDVPNTMNIYVTNQFPAPFTSGGYAYFPGGPERVVMAMGSYGTATMSHEVGHFFALYHTHGNDKDNQVPELVNGSNCSYGGDEICDTPAEEPMNGQSGLTPGCVYTGTALDANGQLYTPMVTNFMSYSEVSCQNTFTPGQFNRIAYTATHERANLVCSSNPEPCGTPITSFPHNQGFEGGTIGSWSQGAGDDFDWTVTNAATPTLNTGPDVAQAGSYFAYAKAATNNPYRTSELYAVCMDLTKTISPELTFYYHMFGANCGNLKLDISTDGGVTWVNKFYKYGNQGNQWNLATVDLKQYVGSTFFRARFMATTSTGDLGDIGLDNIDFHSKACPGTTAAITSTNIGCATTMSGSASITASGTSGPWTYLWNTGATTSSIGSLNAGGYAATVTDNLGCQSTLAAWVDRGAFNVVVTDTVPSSNATSNDGSFTLSITGGTPPYAVTYIHEESLPGTTVTGVTGPTFTATGLAMGMYEVDVTDATGCRQGVAEINIYRYTCKPTGTISSLPYTESFESGAGFWNLDCADVNASSYDWVRTNAATPQALTGPDAASNGSYFIYADALNSAGKIRAYLFGPFLALSSYSRATMLWDYHQYGANAGTLKLTAVKSEEVPAVNTLLWTGPTGDQGNVWKAGGTDLKAIMASANQYLYFEANSPVGGGTAGEIGIDNIRIIDCSGTTVTAVTTNKSCTATNDGAASIALSGAGAPYTYLWSTGATTSSVSGLAVGTYKVTATASNGCLFTETYDVKQVALVASTQVVNQAVNGSNDGAINLTVNEGWPPYTYLWSNGATTQDISGLAPGNYTVTVTDGKGCTVTETATVGAGPCVDPLASVPYNESFEGTTLGSWSNVTGDNFDWSLPFSGATPTANTGPDAAWDGSKYIYTEVTGVGKSKIAILQSACFDLTGASAATFGFKYHYYGATNNLGTTVLEASTDNGATWSAALWTVSANQGNTWLTGSVSLNAYVGKYVRLRFKATTGTGNGDLGDRGLDLLTLTVTPLKQVEPSTFGDGVAAQLGDMMLYPNPTTGRFTVDYRAAGAMPVQARVLDLYGREVVAQGQYCAEGQNSISMDAAALAVGVYVVELQGGGTRVQRRLVITH